MQSDELATRFFRDGFLVFESFFSADQMDPLDRHIREHFGADPAFLHTEEFLHAAQTDVVPWFPQEQGASAFDAIELDSRLNQLTSTILGKDWASHCCMVMFSKQGSKGQAWHQDCAPEDETIFNLNRLVYTRDITADTGGEVVIVPGSHRRGLLPAGDPSGELERQHVLRPGKGTLLLIHGHAWHRVLPVRSGGRFSINYRAAPAGTPRDITDVCVYRNMRYRFSTSERIGDRSG